MKSTPSPHCHRHRDPPPLPHHGRQWYGDEAVFRKPEASVLLRHLLPLNDMVFDLDDTSMDLDETYAG